MQRYRSEHPAMACGFLRKRRVFGEKRCCETDLCCDGFNSRRMRGSILAAGRAVATRPQSASREYCRILPGDGSTGRDPQLSMIQTTYRDLSRTDETAKHRQLA